MKKVSTLIALMLMMTASKAQTIPNAGFENWTNFGSYSNPTNWGSYNYVYPNTPTCEQGTPGAVGNSYLKLTVKNTGTVEMGFAYLANFDALGDVLPAFACNFQPTSLTGKWKYLVSPSDTSMIQIYFFKWNSSTQMSDIVGIGEKEILPGAVSSWTNFSIPISFFSSQMPDSAAIMLGAGIADNPVLNDYLYIDDLGFGASIPTSINQVQDAIQVTLSPNPFSSSTTLNFSELQNNTRITLLDMFGHTLRTIICNGYQYSLDKGDLKEGLYIIQIMDEKGNTITRKIAVE